MMRNRLVLLATLCALAACTHHSGAPERAGVGDWLETTSVLASDAMEGRDVGSPGYARAAAYVAERFTRARLASAGEEGGYFQPVALKDIEIPARQASIRVTHQSGAGRDLRFLHEVYAQPYWGMPENIDGPLVFRGYCAPEDMGNVQGAIVACFGARRAGRTSAASRLDAAMRAGASAVVHVDDMGFTIEPPRWPVAYARRVEFADAPIPAPTIPALRLSAPAFEELAAASGQDGAAILARGARGERLSGFDFGAQLSAHLPTRTRAYVSDNILAVLPGTDAALAGEPILLIAHLDGYGYGEPVDGDGLYNGAFDDAAYVATLIALADARKGRGFRRPVIFAAVTGEEKGLLGSRHLASNPTPAAPTPVAVLNLDQLRPLYPLTILTTLALDESTLGDDVRAIAGPMGIEVRADREPERGLLRRTDHWPFMQRGVPAVSFLFGFDEGTEAQARYRDWYERRYHAPQDDMTTPIDLGAQADFHRFFFALVERVADAEARPRWREESPYRPGSAQ